MLEANEETPRVEANVDALLEQADDVTVATPAPAPAETPAPVEETPEVPAEAAAPVAEQPAAPAEPPSEPQEIKPPEEQVPLSAHLHKLNKTRQRANVMIDGLRAETAALRERVKQLESTQPKDADPLEGFYANPENEGLAPSRELLKQHDEFVAREARRQAAAPAAQPMDPGAAQRATQAINQAQWEVQDIIHLADDRGYITPADAQEIVRAADPVAKALEIARERIEELGKEEDLARLSKLFPPQVPSPAQVTPVTQPKAKAAAPAPKPAAAPAPKPKEETPNAEAQEDEPKMPSREQSVVDWMFAR